MSVYLVNKKLGQTPLERIKELRNSKKISKDIPITYAGRLDPAAEGLLILLSGSDVLKKEKYTKLSKTYVIKILLGIKTDTGDLLGLPHIRVSQKVSLLSLKKVLKSLKGKRQQRYHGFSSKMVGGEPLWKISRQNKKVELPQHEINIMSIKVLGRQNMSLKKILGRLEKVCQLVSGDFRQKEILRSWKKIEDKEFQLFELEVKSSSGSYMRVLAEEIGEKLNENCTCFSIKRTQIESFK